MAHFAEIDENDIVTRVIVVNNNELIENGIESEEKGIDFLEKLFEHRNWVQCSYNGNFRQNFPGQGDKYDREHLAFIRPQPYNSWTLNLSNFQWEPPTSRPTDLDNIYTWDEQSLSWIVVEDYNL